jgi:hypothetical protein
MNHMTAQQAEFEIKNQDAPKSSRREQKSRGKAVLVLCELECESLEDSANTDEELKLLRRHLDSGLDWLNDVSRVIEPEHPGWHIRAFSRVNSSRNEAESLK